MIKIFRFFNILCLDTALGAVSIALLFSYTIGVTITFSVYVALFLSVLFIYNFDHLLDALKLSEDAKSFRHSFYQNYFKSLLIWQIVLGLAGVITIYFLPLNMILAGSCMLILMGLYFWLIFGHYRNNLIYREIFVALGYTCSISLASIFSANFMFQSSYGWLLVIVFLIAITNLWVFSIYDLAIDESENKHSIARSIKGSSFKNLIRATLYLTLILIVVFTIIFNFWAIGFSLFVVELTYLLLLEKQNSFYQEELYRLIGEAVLLFPALVIIIKYAI